MRSHYIIKECAGRLQSQPGELTEFHADVLIRVLLPQLLVFILVAHQWEDHVLVYRLRGQTKHVGEK